MLHPSKLSICLLGVFLLVMFLQVKTLAPADQSEIAPQTGKQQPALPTPTAWVAPNQLDISSQPIAYQAAITAIPQATNTPVPTVTLPVQVSEDFPADFPNFVYAVANSENVVRGVYADGAFAFPVVQQPENDVSFVSTQKDTVTQFHSAAENGIIGLLAHNFLAGAHFYALVPGQTVRVVYGNDTYRRYRITSIQEFQKLNVNSLQSDMVELSTGKRMTTDEVFNRFYTGGEHITLQTCLERSGEPSWGLTFIVAEPY